MKISYTFRVGRETEQVRKKIASQFPQFHPIIEKDGMSFTVLLPHPITVEEEDSIKGLLKDLDKTEGDWAEECDEQYDPETEKLRSLTIEKIHARFEKRRATINGMNLTQSQKDLLMAMTNDDERLARLTLFLLRHERF